MKREENVAIGGRARAVRKRAGKSQSEMAELAGCTNGTWSRYERGEIEMPASALALLSSLGASADWLLSGREANKPAFEGEAKERILRNYPESLLSPCCGRRAMTLGYRDSGEGWLLLRIEDAWDLRDGMTIQLTADDGIALARMIIEAAAPQRHPLRGSYGNLFDRFYGIDEAREQ